jgi:monoterpene epsilon-lactone hydrolase
VVSPLTADLSGLPPLLIQAGTGDPLRPEASRLAEHACEHGVDARLDQYPVDTHVFHTFWTLLPEAADALCRPPVASRPASPRKPDEEPYGPGT